MNPLTKIAQVTGLATTDSVIEHTMAAEQISLQRVDEAAAVPRPESVSKTWVENEYDQLEAEQGPLWAAAGIEASRPAELAAAGLMRAAEGADHLAAGHEQVVDAARDRYLTTTEALSPFRRRAHGGKALHVCAKGALVLGDAVGVTLLGINIGDYPVLAGLMSISAATAAVISGLIGSEIRVLRDTRRRQFDIGLLTDTQKRFMHLFSGTDKGAKVIKAVVGVSTAAGLLIASAIFAGRAELEGAMTGLIYGGIAAAVAAGSFLESYAYADEIADQIDNAEHAYEKELARHQRLAGAGTLRDQAKRLAEAESIVREHDQRGEAAMKRIRSLMYGILRRSPGVVGHGAASEPPIGRINRAGGPQ
ncbi:hypothetical protein [Herbiconiux daphne]|uniref:SLATT domain-containing protein n=1 Tax=Herbiconiux daphne TaxID=2970914 RepID=A0ABT2H542_9MICO|nr:hypothetical protein [Herbiconiux daphne]MCS5735057.1 hypothetical protein [Herbiconiux daphne]